MIVPDELLHVALGVLIGGALDHFVLPWFVGRWIALRRPRGRS